MNALRFAQKGAIESVLKLEQVPKPSLAAGEALVRVKAAGINGVRSMSLSQPIRYASLTDISPSSPIALESKVGSPSPLYLVFPAEISPEKLSTFSTTLQRTGLARKFGGLGVPGVSRLMEPMQSVFLSVFSCTRFADTHLAGLGSRK